MIWLFNLEKISWEESLGPVDFSDSIFLIKVENEDILQIRNIFIWNGLVETGRYEFIKQRTSEGKGLSAIVKRIMK